MQTDAITPTSGMSPPSNTSAAQTDAAKAFGLSFDSLLKIILTQLTYQDPLKPMDNFQFVSQLAQFSQVQQGQTANDRLQTLVRAQGANQATGLLGKLVDVPAGGATMTGTVTAIAFNDGAPTITVETDDNKTISGIAISNVSQIREKK
ncbi:flagellar hook capping FlgD N-terminal domain-containing protein [uncultured Sphingomonas sp.]|uniref:flagellar hook assembly protein FlgD n=1 Tax=uncultured Sphingomonas sp. TaxID=158754 RepID=UPI0025E5739A|nr:flagellar hook capping FlgD N-terminal domain-containing protein [uncultured Sphingomonas sp.]